MTLLLIIFVLQLLIPFALLLWQWRSPVRSRLNWILKTLLVAGYLTAITIAGIWVLPPRYAPYVYGGFFFIATLRSLRKARGLGWLPVQRWEGSFRLGIHAALAISFFAMAAYALSGYRSPASVPVALAFPLRGGTYQVVNGGGNIALSFHVQTLHDERFRQ